MLNDTGRNYDILDRLYKKINTLRSAYHFFSYNNIKILINNGYITNWNTVYASMTSYNIYKIKP